MINEINRSLLFIPDSESSKIKTLTLITSKLLQINLYNLNEGNGVNSLLVTGSLRYRHTGYFANSNWTSLSSARNWCSSSSSSWRFSGLGHLAYSDSDLTSEILNPFRHYGGLLRRRIGLPPGLYLHRAAQYRKCGHSNPWPQCFNGPSKYSPLTENRCEIMLCIKTMLFGYQKEQDHVRSQGSSVSVMTRLRVGRRSSISGRNNGGISYSPPIVSR